MYRHAAIRQMSKATAVLKVFVGFLEDEAGATAIEYGLIAGLIAVVIIGAISAVGTSLQAKFNTVANALT